MTFETIRPPLARSDTSTVDTQPPAGLSAADVAARVSAGETNHFRPRTSRTYRDVFLDNLVNPFNIGLTALVIALVVLGQPGDSFFSAFAVVANTLVAIVQEVRAKRQMDKLARMAERTVVAVRDGQAVTIGEREIVRDDVVSLGAGDRVPVDGPVVFARALEVSESLITGESDPISKAPGDTLTSGSYVTAGTGLMRAEKIGAESFVNSLGHLASRIKLERTPLQRRIDAIVWISLLVMCLFAPLHVVASLHNGEPFVNLVRNSIVLITTFVPQGVVLATTVALTFGAVRISRRRTLVQRLNAIESMGNVTVLCFDKTGTLTENRLSVVRIVPLSGDLDAAAAEAGVRSDLARYVGALGSKNATAEAIEAEVGEGMTDPSRGPGIAGEVPFASALKWGAVLYDDGTAEILGAPEFLLGQEHLATSAELAAEGYRVLAYVRSSEAGAHEALGAKNLPGGLEPVGLVVLQDRIREGIVDTLRAFADRDVALKVISGDSVETVAAIAREAGISVESALSGAELMRMDEAEFAGAVRRATVFARITPDLKRRIVTSLRAAGEYVAMVGDGVNDVPALKAAQLGIAMDAGAQIAKEVGELVLLDNNVETLPRALVEGYVTIEKAYATCRIFLAKNFYMVLMFLMVGYANLPFPGQVREVSWATVITAALPTTLIAFGVVKPKPIRRFVRNVVGYILVTGTFGAAVLTVAYIFGYVTSGEDVGISRSFLILFASAYGVLIFWDTCGLNPTAWRSYRSHPGIALGGLAIGLLALAPQLLPEYFTASQLPPLYWLTFALAMPPIVWVFRRLVAERVGLIRPVRSLFEGA